MSLKRQGAIELLKEIVEATKSVNYKHISLKPPSGNTQTKSESYELHIKNHLNEADWKSLKNIAQKHSLSIKEYNGYFIIYKPKTE